MGRLRLDWQVEWDRDEKPRGGEEIKLGKTQTLQHIPTAVYSPQSLEWY